MESEKNNQVIVANPNIVFREEFDDWALLFNPENGAVIGLNPIGTFIRKRLDGSHSILDITSEINEHFDEVPPNMENEVQNFVDELVKKGYATYLDLTQ